MNLPHAGIPWEPLASLLSCRPNLIDGLESDLETSIRQMLHDKIQSDCTKFDPSDQVRVSISDDGAVHTTTDAGKYLSSLFRAEGERVVLYLAVRAAIGELLAVDLPIETDSLDRFLSYSRQEFVRRLLV